MSRKTPKDVVRKLLYGTIKHAFDEVDAQFDELCQCLYSEIMDDNRGKCIFEELIDSLLCIGENLIEYTNQQMEVIGMDKDCDIKFIKGKLVNYQLITTELKGGVSEGRTHAIRFAPDNAKKNLIVPKYDKLFSLANEMEEVLQILYESYQKLYDVIYSDESELVLNRFNKQFKNVKEHLLTESPLNCYSLTEKLLEFGVVPVSKEAINLFRDCRGFDILLSKVVEESIGNEFYSVYDNPFELAKTIQNKQLDNIQVNELLMTIAMLGMLSEKQHGVKNLFSRPRGRPLRNLCYEDCIEPLKEIVQDIQARFTPKMKRTDRKLFFNWSVAVVVALMLQYGDKFYGCISAFYRFFERIGLKIPYGLRYFQKKIKDFSTYLHDKLKGGFYEFFDEVPTKSWARKLKRFTPLEKIKDIIIENFFQFNLA